MGGKGRILMSALSLAAGSNITGSTGQMLQAATVNVIQSYGAQQIKLLADSMNSEVARTALQGMLAGAGAAAQGQNATPAALGASASVVLNNLIDSAYGETSSTLSLAEREARKNLVSTLITGTTHALGGEAALANAGAVIEMENNYLHAGEDKKRQDTQLLLQYNALPADNRAGAQRLVDELNAKDQELDDLFRNSCQSLDSEQCQAIRHDLQLALQSYEKNIPDTCVSFSQVYDGKRKIEKLISEHETAKAKVAHESYIKLIAENHAISLKTAGQLYNAMKVLHTGSAIAGAYYGMKTPNLAQAPKVPSKVTGVSDKLTTGKPLSKAGPVATKIPGASSSSSASAVVNNLEKLPWNSWQQYEKVAIDGRQYAQIGKRLYSQHAVDRMQPSGLGAPAGAIGPGRNVTPNMVENIIRNGTSQHNIVDGTSRTIYWHGNVGVVTAGSDHIRTLIPI